MIASSASLTASLFPVFCGPASRSINQKLLFFLFVLFFSFRSPLRAKASLSVSAAGFSFDVLRRVPDVSWSRDADQCDGSAAGSFRRSVRI